MKKYYLDKQFKDSVYDAYYSYENGAVDDLYFDTQEEAENYADKVKWRLADDEIYEIMEVEENETI